MKWKSDNQNRTKDSNLIHNVSTTESTGETQNSTLSYRPNMNNGANIDRKTTQMGRYL